MSFRNRCMVAGAQGPVTLTVPLLGGRDQRVMMKDVKIDNRQKWQTMHWRTISSCYNRSPWFEHFRDEVKSLYEVADDYLLDWNIRCFEWSARVLGIQTAVEKTESFLKVVTPETGDWRNRLLPKNREQWASNLRYHQVFEERTGFIPGLSILDLIFCEGRMAAKKIRN